MGIHVSSKHQLEAFGCIKYYAAGSQIVMDDQVKKVQLKDFALVRDLFKKDKMQIFVKNQPSETH